MITQKPQVQPLGKADHNYQSHSPKTSPQYPRFVLAISIVALIIFSVLAAHITKGKEFSFDISILKTIHDSSAGIFGFVATISNVGNPANVLIAAVVIGAALAYKHRYRSAILLLLSVFGAETLTGILKALFHRPRPDFWEAASHKATYAFPSGHAMGSSAFAISLMVIFWPTRYRWYAVLVGVPFAVSVGLGRVYLGKHFPTDVIAGWCASIITVASVHWLLHRLRNTDHTWAKRYLVDN